MLLCVAKSGARIDGRELYLIFGPTMYAWQKLRVRSGCLTGNSTRTFLYYPNPALNVFLVLILLCM